MPANAKKPGKASEHITWINGALLKFKSREVERLLKNFISLSVLQGLNYILPLITVPYLTRILGPEKYGLILFATAFMSYFAILTDYGFNLSATRDISINRDDRQRVSDIFSAVMVIKLALLVISFIIMMGIVFSFAKFREQNLLYIVLFGTVLGGALFPVWFFQGIESMKYITYLNVAAKGIYTLLIFVLVTGPEKFMVVVALNAASSLAAGVCSLLIVGRVFKVRIVLPGMSALKNQLLEGWYVFISSISIVLYSSSTTFILGLLTNNTAVGYFGGADKIRSALQNLFGPAFQTLYPYVSKLAKDSKEEALQFIGKELIFLGGIALILCLVLSIKADFLVRLVLGKEYGASVPALRLLAFLPFLVVLGNVLTIQCLLSFGFKKDYSRVYISSSAIGVIAIFFLTYFYSYIGTSCSILFIELLVVVMTVHAIWSNGIKLFGNR